MVKSWRRYSINGYKFRAFKEGVDVSKSTLSNGVSVNSTEGLDYYGTLNEVIELSYYAEQRVYMVILFKCDWFDNSPQGLSIHKVYGLVDVNEKKKLRGHNPFVAAFQVDQVCYAPYPTIKKGNQGIQWSAVFKTKAR
ncbi:uncharacterized protein LOC141653620 [Silene latifolia]|uniref:uncharacterized protein LOC141653620 n=1 Tax=Silene latifolia TaxID=37657 RepID=UPI003D77B5EC